MFLDLNEWFGGKQSEGEKSGFKFATGGSLLYKLIRVLSQQVVLIHQLTRVSVQGARVSCLNGPVTDV